MILKLLLVIGVIALVYFMFIKQKPHTQKTAPKKTAKKKKQPDVDDMIECESCGIYVSIEESLLSNGHYYCSRECVRKAQ